MAVYAVGDIHGCYDQLQDLLATVHFDPLSDQLWAVGDLVNRGPKSLQVLQYLHHLGDACQCVLGNHELSLLFRSGEEKRRTHPYFSSFFEARDAEHLLHWLRHRPLFHQDPVKGWCMVHASVHPEWTLQQAASYAQTLEYILQSDDWWAFLSRALQTPTAIREPDQKGSDAHLFFCLSIFTRARYCSPHADFDWHSKKIFPDKTPWFSLRSPENMRIIYGHWAAMGLVHDQTHVLGLDSGCVWGKKLTAARLDQTPVKITQVLGWQKTPKQQK